MNKQASETELSEGEILVSEAQKTPEPVRNGKGLRGAGDPGE